MDDDKENVTKYGEFVSSYFAWLTPERQKKRAEDLENAGKVVKGDGAFWQLELELFESVPDSSKWGCQNAPSPLTTVKNKQK